jgi:hypothetical protein
MVLNGGTYRGDVLAAGTVTVESTEATPAPVADTTPSLTGNVDLYITGGTFEGNIVGTGTTSVSGDVNLYISGGDFSNCTGIYAGAINSGAGDLSVDINGGQTAGLRAVVDGDVNEGWKQFHYHRDGKLPR